MPETQIYSLHVPAGKHIQNTKADTSMAILVDSPRYLSQPYIVYRNSPYQLLISRYSKWDSAPDETVRQAFRDALSSSGLFKDVRSSNVVPGGFYSLRINLKRFERLDEGNDSFGELALDVSLFAPEGRDLYQGTFIKKVKLEDRSSISLAKALSSSLVEAMEEVRTNIEKSLKQ